MSYKTLGALLLACSMGGSLLASTHANKTYHATRGELHQRGREWAQSAPHKGQANGGGKFGATVEVSGFGSRSTNEYGMGQYFGAAREDDKSDAVGTVQVVRDTNILQDKTNALYGQLIDYRQDYVAAGGSGDTNAPMNSVLTLRPHQDRVGAHVKLGWTADKVAACLKGVRFSVDVPVVRVSNTLGVTEASEVASTADGTSTPLTYFTGAYSKTAPVTDVQAAVTHGKLSTIALDKTGVADVRVGAAYDVVTGDDCGLSFKASMIVPTGNKSDAKHLWEPVVGNNKHWGAGVGFDAHSRLWENAQKRMSLWLSGSAEFSYLFRGREKRIAGIYNTSLSRTTGWMQYALARKKEAASTSLAAGGTPFVNVLAQDMYVTPGSHFETVMGLTLCWRKFHFNFGYNVFYKQSETVVLADEWENDMYQVLDGTTAMNSGDALTLPVQKPGKTSTAISGATVSQYLDLNACTTPDAETHTFLFGAGYDGQVKNMKFSSSLGASYEIAANNNKALQGWALFGKLGFSF